MIKWITENLGTAEINDVNDKEYSVVDVRNLVDKEGNSDQAILERIDTVIDLLKQNHKVVVCCDYGISRSNAIAIGAIVKYLGYDFDEAVKFVMEETGKKAIHVDILNSVRHVLGINKRGNMPINNKILITGGAGFVGSTLAARLKKGRLLVRNLPRSSTLLLVPFPPTSSHQPTLAFPLGFGCILPTLSRMLSLSFSPGQSPSSFFRVLFWPAQIFAHVAVPAQVWDLSVKLHYCIREFFPLFFFLFSLLLFLFLPFFSLFFPPLFPPTNMKNLPTLVKFSSLWPKPQSASVEFSPDHMRCSHVPTECRNPDWHSVHWLFQSQQSHLSPLACHRRRGMPHLSMPPSQRRKNLSWIHHHGVQGCCHL